MNHVQRGSFLTLHYRLAGPEGDVVNTFSEKPATLTLGTGELAPAIEERLIGLAEGTRTAFELAPGEAFGPRSPDMLQRVTRTLLQAHSEPGATYERGDVVELPTPDGLGSCAGVVRDVADDWVLVDFNHPLAGAPLTFEVQLIGVL